MKQFRDYAPENQKWISFVDSDFFPDNVLTAQGTYFPLIRRFGEILSSAKDSQQLYLLIMKEPMSRRIQLLRIFRKYVSPDTSVEMLKRSRKAVELVRDFGMRFRAINIVRERFNSRPVPDEALIAILREYEDRGEKGYQLTSEFFEWFKKIFGKKFAIEGPERAGKDIELSEILPGYAKPRPVDFVIRDLKGKPIAIGFARYDSDRGGSQEDDRTGGYGNAVTEILGYAKNKGVTLKIIFVNEVQDFCLGPCGGIIPPWKMAERTGLWLRRLRCFKKE